MKRDNLIPSFWHLGLLILAALLTLFTAPALAQEACDESGHPAVSVGGQYIGNSEFDDGGGKVSSTTAYVAGTWEWLEVSYARTSFSWDDVNRMPIGNGVDDPWDTLHVLDVSASHEEMLDEHWGWFAGGGVGAAWEDEISGAFGATAYGGGIYAWSENVAITFGLAGFGHKTGYDLMPLLGVQWDYVGEDGSGFYASLGIPETLVGYAFCEEFSLTLALDGEGTVYRLADDSTVARKGYAGLEEMSLALLAQWAPTENTLLTFGPSYHFDRSVTLYTEDGGRSRDYDLDNAVGCGVDFSIAF